MRTHGHCVVSPFPLHQQRSRPAVAAVVVDEVLPPQAAEGAEVTDVEAVRPPDRVLPRVVAVPVVVGTVEVQHPLLQPRRQPCPPSIFG
jgi:hypothetical protein